MNNRYFLKKFALAVSILLAVAAVSFAQTTKSAAPRQEKLLNNLKLLMWTDAGGDKVTVKLRIHSGAAFDTLGKEGTMALLADAFFPNEAVKEFFRDDLGGSLDVESNFDYIQINATGNADQILTILETVSNAVTKLQIDKDTTKKIADARLERVKELEKNPAYLADQAVVKNLFGTFPYGKSAEGTSASLLKIDFADLILARQRFLTADNATLAVSGNIKTDYVFKVVRQLFGGWEKADKRVPATFAQPNAPAKDSFLTQIETPNTSELRFAFRSLARNDKDYAAAEIAARILQNRFQTKEGKSATATHVARFLPGYVVLKVSGWNVGMVEVDGDRIALPVDFFETVPNLLKAEINAEEFERARSEFAAERSRRGALDAWLDADTYKLVSVADDAQKANAVSIADAQRIFARWRKEPSVETLILSKAK